MPTTVNEQSLQRANAFLAAVAARVEVGELLKATPADLGKDAGFTEPLAAARAVRALLARKRLEAEDGAYRLLDARPVEPGEPEAIPRKPRRKKDAGAKAAADPTKLTYATVGHAAIDRLVELGREIGTLRASSRIAKEESRDAKVRADDAERRAHDLAGRVKDLEAKLEMAEQNLRTLLIAAKGGTRGEEDTGGPVGDTEMAAILGILKDKTG